MTEKRGLARLIERINEIRFTLPIGKEGLTIPASLIIVVLVPICCCCSLLALPSSDEASPPPISPTITQRPQSSPTSPPPTATQEPTHTPEPTRTPEPTATTAPTATPESKFSPEESQYMTEVSGVTTSYIIALTTISGLSSEASQNALLFLDDEWKMKMAVAIALLKVNYDVVSEMTPPAKFDDLHTGLLKAAANFSIAADLLAEGIDELDAAKINLASEHITLGSEWIAIITEEISE